MKKPTLPSWRQLAPGLATVSRAFDQPLESRNQNTSSIEEACSYRRFQILVAIFSSQTTGREAGPTKEGVLSKRRIAFTDHQIYWECQGMATHESINMPLFLMPSASDEDSELRMADFMLTGIFKGDSYSGGSLSNQDNFVIVEDNTYRLDYGFPIHHEATTQAQLRGLNEHIRAFSKRRLSYDTDVMPAFLGILGLYKQNKLLYLLHGIPMWMGGIGGDKTGAQITLALSMTSWYHRTGPNH
jgi:hypothetical protein